MQITEDVNKTKNPEHPFVDIDKKETCAKFQQKRFNSMKVGGCQREISHGSSPAHCNSLDKD